jgi:hypothetical protein
MKPRRSSGVGAFPKFNGQVVILFAEPARPVWRRAWRIYLNQIEPQQVYYYLC